MRSWSPSYDVSTIIAGCSTTSFLVHTRSPVKRTAGSRSIRRRRSPLNMQRDKHQRPPSYPWTGWRTNRWQKKWQSNRQKIRQNESAKPPNTIIHREIRAIRFHLFRKKPGKKGETCQRILRARMRRVNLSTRKEGGRHAARHWTKRHRTGSLLPRRPHPYSAAGKAADTAKQKRTGRNARSRWSKEGTRLVKRARAQLVRNAPTHRLIPWRVRLCTKSQLLLGI